MEDSIYIDSQKRKRKGVVNRVKIWQARQ